MELNIEQLASYLSYSSSQEELKQKEAFLNQIKSHPNYLPALLSLATSQYPQETRLNAAIQMKNFINNYWKFKYGADNSSITFNEPRPIIPIQDKVKEELRNQILESIMTLINEKNFKIVKQLKQCLKRILYFDFEKFLKTSFTNKIIQLLSSNEQNAIYCGIIFLSQLTKLYEYEAEEKKQFFQMLFTDMHDKLINIFSQCPNSTDPNQAQFLYKIIKIYIKVFKTSKIPRCFPTDNATSFDKFTSYIMYIMQTPIEKYNEYDKKSPVWRVKQVSYIFFEQLLRKHLTKKRVNNELCKFMFDTLTNKLLNIIKTIYVNANENKKYINYDSKFYLYKILSFYVNENIKANEIINMFLNDPEKKMLRQLVDDGSILKTDLESLIYEPKTYINNAIDIDLGLTTVRCAAYRLALSIFNYKDKSNNSTFNQFYNLFIEFLTDIQLELYNENEQVQKNFSGNQNYILKRENVQYNLFKEAVLYIFQNSINVIMKNAEQTVGKFIEVFIVPEFINVIPFMRERACTFIEMLKGYKIKNNNLLIQIAKNICDILEKDTSLPVRVMAGLAASSLLRYEPVRNLLRGNVKTLLSLYIKILNEMDISEIIECFETIIRYFKGESQEFIVALIDYLTRYLIKNNKKDDTGVEGGTGNDNDDDDDKYEKLLVTKQVIQTINEIISPFINNEEIYNKIEQYINFVLVFCFKNRSVSIAESGIMIVENIVINAKKIPKNIWGFYIDILQTVINSDTDIESIEDVMKIICQFIIKDPQTFITEGTKINNVQKSYLIHTIEYANSAIEISEKDENYSNISFCFNILGVILQTYQNQIDSIVVDLVNFVQRKISLNIQSKKYKLLLCDLISYISAYNPRVFVNYNFIIDFWLISVNKSNTKRRYKVNIIGLCNLLLVAENFDLEKLKQLVLTIYSLAKKTTKNDKEILEEENEEDLNQKVDELGEFYEEIHDIDDEKDYFDGFDDDSDKEEPELLTILSLNEIKYMKDTLNHIVTNNSYYMDKIKQLVGDEVINNLNKIILEEEKKKS